MIRVLTILAAIAALAVSAAPASANNCCAGAHYCAYTPKAGDNSTKPPPRGTAGCTLIGEVTFPKARGAGVIDSLGQKYTASALEPRRLGTRSGGEVVSDFAKSKPKPAGVYDHGLTQALASRTGPHADGLYVAKNPMSIGITSKVKAGPNGIIAVLIGA